MVLSVVFEDCAGSVGRSLDGEAADLDGFFVYFGAVACWQKQVSGQADNRNDQVPEDGEVDVLETFIIFETILEKLLLFVEILNRYLVRYRLLETVLLDLPNIAVNELVPGGTQSFYHRHLHIKIDEDQVGQHEERRQLDFEPATHHQAQQNNLNCRSYKAITKGLLELFHFLDNLVTPYSIKFKSARSQFSHLLVAFTKTMQVRQWPLDPDTKLFASLGF